MSLTFGSDVRRTFCTLCPQHCGMLVQVRDGQPVRIDGDRENPVAKGKLCPKGAFCLDVHEHPDRLNTPLRRVGPRGSNQWEAISWDLALDEIAAKLADIRRREGPEALGTLGGTHKGPGDWASWRFASHFGTPNYVSQGRNCGVGEFLTETSVYGWDTIYQAPHPGTTKCVVIWGCNPAESSPPSWVRLQACQAAGAKLIVIDPRVTKSAKRADLHLAIRPRTDGALALGMIHVMIQENLYDREFVDKWCLGFDEVRTIAAEWTPQRTAEVTALDPQLIVEAARMYAQNRPARISFGVAPTQLGEGASRSALLGRAILRAISGNLDVPGGEPLGNPYDTSQFAWLESIGFERLVDHPLRTRESVNAAETPICSVSGYRAFREAMAKVYPDGHTGCAYMFFASQPAIYRAIIDQHPYPIRALIVQGGEPLLTMGGAKQAHQAFTHENLELLVVMDHWKTPTGQLADYLLPAADFLERPDISAHWGIGNFFVVAQKVVEPLQERRNDYNLWSGLGRRLLDPTDWPATLEGMLDRFLVPSGKSYREWADGACNHHFPRLRWRKYEQRGFATPSGKVELVPSLFARMGIEPRPVYTGPPYALEDADLADYPLLMIPGSRYLELTASNLRQVPQLKKRHPEPIVDVHPGLAAEMALEEGEWVLIERPEGAIRQRVRINPDIRRDTVHPDGYWWEPGTAAGEPNLSGAWDSNANAITPADPRLSSFAGDQPLRGARCRLRKCATSAPTAQ